METGYMVAKVGARSNRAVFIREFNLAEHPTQAENALTKRQAWERAQRLAQAVTVGPKPKQHDILHIHFTGVDGMTTDLGPADEIVKALDKTEEKCNNTPMPTAATPTEKQIDLFNKLATELGQLAGNADYSYTAGFKAGCTRQEASEAITAAIACVKEAKANQTQPQHKPQQSNDEVVSFPAGRYALTGDDGSTRFFKVDRPTEGRWAGYTFLKIQAGDDFFPVKDKAKRTRILSMIADDPKAASIRYGHEIGACGVCGRTLTDEESRAAGIGPICQGKMGW